MRYILLFPENSVFVVTDNPITIGEIICDSEGKRNKVVSIARGVVTDVRDNELTTPCVYLEKA